MTAIVDRNLWTAFGRVLDAPVLVRVIASLVLAALVASSAALAPVFLAQLVDGLSAGGVGLAGLAGAYVGALCFGRLAGHVQAFYYAASDQALQRRVSELTFDRLIHLPMSFHLGANPGVLIQTHGHALQGIRMVLALACATLVPIIFQMAVILWIVGSRFDMNIWLIVCLTIIAYACVFAWGVGRTRDATSVALHRQVETSGLLSEGLANVEAIKNCTAEHRLGQSYAKTARDAERGWETCAYRRLETGIVTAAVFVASVSCSIGFGLEGVRAGQMSAGDFLLLVTYMVQIIGPLEMSGYAVRDLTQGAAHLAGWTDLFAVAPERDVGEAPACAGMRTGRAPPAITFERVSLSYGAGQRVLSDVSFSVAAGTTVAIVGVTGGGKTSLLRVLQKHVSPDTGRVWIDAVSLSQIDPHLVRRRIAVVSQDVMLFNASLRYNLMLANPDANDDDMMRVLRIARLDKLVESLREGLDTVVGDKGFKLSGGERQRVAIARALLRDGDILLLDEATSALDAGTERDLCEELMAMSEGRTTLIVTHRLALAARAAKIIVLQKGRVVEQGRHDQLMAEKGAYYRLWTTQMDFTS